MDLVKKKKVLTALPMVVLLILASVFLYSCTETEIATETEFESNGAGIETEIEPKLEEEPSLADMSMAESAHGDGGREEMSVIVYSERNKGGSSVRLEIGEYTREYLTEAGVSGIASVRIPDGIHIRLHRDEYFGGGFLELRYDQSDLTRSGWYHNIVRITVREFIEHEPQVRNFNYVLGTQIFDPTYGTSNVRSNWTLEGAREIYRMGSNVLKTRERDFRRILDELQFTFIYIWVDSNPVWQLRYGGLDAARVQQLYDEMYKFVQTLLIDFNDTGKTFFIGHWEGCWYLLEGFDYSIQTVGDDNIEGMTLWLNTRQRAIDDAKRSTPHENVNVWGYTEAVRTSDIKRNNSERVVNTVLPNTNVDYLSYSAYDIQWMSSERISEFIEYMESMIPEKDGVPLLGNKRTFIGEFGTPAFQTGFNQERHNQENIEMIIKFFDAGVSQILYWAMFCNELFDDGTNRGFWLIDNTGQKWKLYYSFKAFYSNAKEYVREYLAEHGETPDATTFNRWASAFLRTLAPIIQEDLTKVDYFRILSLNERPVGWSGTINTEDYIQGTGSFQTVVATQGGSIVLPLSIPETDMSILKRNTAYIEFYLHVNDINLFNRLGFEISSAGRPDIEEYQWNIHARNLSTGWNTVRLSLNDSPPDVTPDGGPDLSRINFIRWYMIECNAGLQLRFDDLRIVEYTEPLNELIAPLLR